MNYLLTLLTNGRREYLERSLAAFFQHATPEPSAVFVMDDGGQSAKAHANFSQMIPPTIEWAYADSPAPLGMCGAYSRCGEAAAASDLPWVFHLEDDQVLLRPLNLNHLREVLDAEPDVAQMALVRTPWGREVEYGGYIPQFPGYYERRETTVRAEWLHRPSDEEAVFALTRSRWIATTRNWATSPALFRTSLAREFPWGAEPGCETEIGPRIIAARGPDTRFGLWGGGEPWVAHIGVERQPGAKGY